MSSRLPAMIRLLPTRHPSSPSNTISLWNQRLITYRPLEILIQTTAHRTISWLENKNKDPRPQTSKINNKKTEEPELRIKRFFDEAHNQLLHPPWLMASSSLLLRATTFSIFPVGNIWTKHSGYVFTEYFTNVNFKSLGKEGRRVNWLACFLVSLTVHLFLKHIYFILDVWLWAYPLTEELSLQLMILISVVGQSVGPQPLQGMAPVNSFSLLYHPPNSLRGEDPEWKSFTSNLTFDMKLNPSWSRLLLDFINTCYSYSGN